MSNLFDYSSGAGGAQPSKGCGIPDTQGCLDNFFVYIPTPNCQLPIVTSPGAVTSIVGSAFSYQVFATGDSTITVSNLPDWLTYDGTFITGTVPDEIGLEGFSITAQNACGQGVKNVTITIICDIPEASGIWDMPTFNAPLGGGLVYAGTFAGSVYHPPTYPTGFVGDYTPYPIGLTQAEFTQLLNAQTLVISSNIEFGGYEQADPTVTFAYSDFSDQGFGMPTQPDCALEVVMGTSGPITYSFFDGSPQVYKFQGMYYPAIKVRHQDDTYLNLATLSGDVVIPKLWPVFSKILGKNVKMLYDDFSTYDSFYGIPGDNGPWIQGTLGGITIA